MNVYQRGFLGTLRETLRRVDRRLEHAIDPATVQAFTPFYASLAEAYQDGWRNAPCVFVLSTGRVGTQSLTALSALSPEVAAFHEPDPRLIKTSSDAYLNYETIRHDEGWHRLVLAARDDHVFRASRQGKTYLETNNRLTYLAPVLAEVFPASRFIHLHRHPYDVIRSAMRRRYYCGHNWDFARVRPRPQEDDARYWQHWSTLEKNAWYWHRVNAMILEFFEDLAPERQFTLSANDLFSGDETVLKNLFRFISGIEPCSTDVGRVLGKKLNAQTHRHYPLPGEWTEPQCESVRNMVGTTATVLGYTL